MREKYLRKETVTNAITNIVHRCTPLQANAHSHLDTSCSQTVNSATHSIWLFWSEKSWCELFTHECSNWQTVTWRQCSVVKIFKRYQKGCWQLLLPNPLYYASSMSFCVVFNGAMCHSDKETAWDYWNNKGLHTKYTESWQIWLS